MVWMIKKDDEGNVVEKKAKGRGRPPRNYTKAEDGNWYYNPPWKDAISTPKKVEAGTEGETEGEGEPEVEVVKPRRIKRVTADNPTTAEAFAKGCNVLSYDIENDIITLHSPVVSGVTGLSDIDDIDGSPVYHKIELNKRMGTVSIWDISAPASPSIVISNALVI